MTQIRNLATHPDAHITPREFGHFLKVDRTTVVKWIKAGILPALKLPSGDYRINTEDALAFMVAQRVGTPTEGPYTVTREG